MQSPVLISQMEEILGIRLHLAPVRGEDFLSGLMSYKSEPEDSSRPWCKYALKDGQIIGLNLANTGLRNEHLAQLLALPELDVRRLQALNLSGNQLTHIDLCGLPALQRFDASDNAELEQLDFPEAGLSQLQELLMTGCGKLTSLNLPRGMDQLVILDMGGGALQRISFRDACPALRQLDLRNNQLQRFHLPEGFAALAYLNLDHNQLTDFFSAQRLPALQSLYLRSNQLTRFSSATLAQMPALEALYLFENKLQGIPQETIGGEHKNCFTDLRNYFSSADKSQLIRLHEAKLILVGNPEVGKSSIRLKLENIKNSPTEKEDRTQGLDIGLYEVKGLPYHITGLPKPVNFQLHIWDFGGQGKYREVQQLFCSRRSLYLFVTAHDDQPEKDHYVDFSYWVSMVNAYSYDRVEGKPSPVLHVVNKIDEKPRFIDQNKQKEQFENLAGFVAISCKTGENFDQLKELIAKTLPEISSDIFHTEIPGNWLKIKETLKDKSKDNHITYSDFLKICTEGNGLTEDEARSCLRLLDSTGIVIAFGENPQLNDWIVLNPNWVKSALYEVLDSKAVFGGALSHEAFELIWSEQKGYSPEDRLHLLNLMQAYDLCYPQDNAFGDTEYVIPALLTDRQAPLPQPFHQEPTCRLRFVFEPYYPAGALNKLMVRLHRYIYGGLKWKDNVVLHDIQQNSLVHLSEKWNERAIEAVFCGGGFGDLFGIVNSALQSLTQALKDTKFMFHLSFKCQGQYEGEWVSLPIWEQLSRIQLSVKMEADELAGLRAGRAERPQPGQPPQPIPIKPAKEGKPDLDELSERGQIKILFVASNPMDESRLQPDVEYQKLNEKLSQGRASDRFTWLNPCFAASLDALIRAKNEGPHILHFAGHGTQEGIILSDNHNNKQVLNQRALRRMFNDLQDTACLVVLNACYSAEHARLISEHGIWVIGHNLPIGDNAAIRFAEGFYTGLSEGRKVADAFNDGMIFLENDFPHEAGKVEVWKDGIQQFL